MNKVGQIPELIFRALIMLNFMIILFVTLVTYHALWGYVHEGSALDFLIKAGYVPPENWVFPVTAMMLYGCLVLLLTVECNNHPELVFKLSLEFAIAIGREISCRAGSARSRCQRCGTITGPIIREGFWAFSICWVLSISLSLSSIWSYLLWRR